MIIACGFDHAGFPLREPLLREIAEAGHEVLDLGTDKPDPPIDYPEKALATYGCRLADWASLEALDALVLAVPHREYVEDPGRLLGRVAPGGVVIDVRSAIPATAIPANIAYWSL